MELSTATAATSLASTDRIPGLVGGNERAITVNLLVYKHSDGNYHCDNGSAAGTVLAIGSGGTTSFPTALVINSSSNAANGGYVRFDRNSSPEFFLGNTAAALGSGTGSIFYNYNNVPHAFYVAGAPILSIAAAAVTPGSDNAITAGSASFRFSVVYAGTGTINTSDEREKQQVEDFPDELLDAWGAVEWRQFKLNDAVAAKSDDARWHFGAVAQQVRDAIDGALGKGEALRLGLLCHDEWEAIAPTEAVPAVEEERDKEGEIIVHSRPEIPAQPGRGAGDRWGLRYDECFAIEAAYQRRRMARIEAAIAGLGGKL